MRADVQTSLWQCTRNTCSMMPDLNLQCKCSEFAVTPQHTRKQHIGIWLQLQQMHHRQALTSYFVLDSQELALPHCWCACNMDTACRSCIHFFAHLLALQWKVAPALAAGCCAVLKPSELASVTCLELAAIAHEVGLPAGVFNVVTGDGPNAGAPLRCVIHGHGSA